MDTINFSSWWWKHYQLDMVTIVNEDYLVTPTTGTSSDIMLASGLAALHFCKLIPWWFKLVFRCVGVEGSSSSALAMEFSPFSIDTLYLSAVLSELYEYTYINIPISSYTDIDSRW